MLGPTAASPPSHTLTRCWAPWPPLCTSKKRGRCLQPAVRSEQCIPWVAALVAVQGLRDQVAQRRAEADRELKRKERLEREMKELVGGRRGETRALHMHARQCNPDALWCHTTARVPAAPLKTSDCCSACCETLVPLHRAACRQRQPLEGTPMVTHACGCDLSRAISQRAALEARQQDIRDKQLAVQQSADYCEKLKVRFCTACLPACFGLKSVQPHRNLRHKPCKILCIALKMDPDLPYPGMVGNRLCSLPAKQEPDAVLAAPRAGCTVPTRLPDSPSGHALPPA